MRNTLILIGIVVFLTISLVSLVLTLQGQAQPGGMMGPGMTGGQTQAQPSPAPSQPGEHRHDDMHQMMDQCSQMMRGMSMMMGMMGQMGGMMGPATRSLEPQPGRR